jgi:beta-1,2-xylosyltransferase
MKRATFTIHDQPSILLDHARQEELLTAAKAKTGENHRPFLLRLLMTVSNHPNEEDRYEQDWNKACAKDSPLNKGEKELRELSGSFGFTASNESAQSDTFISRHTAAMDICEHPSVSSQGTQSKEHTDI